MRRDGLASLECTGPDCDIDYSESGEVIRCSGANAVCGGEGRPGQASSTRVIISGKSLLCGQLLVEMKSTVGDNHTLGIYNAAKRIENWQICTNTSPNTEYNCGFYQFSIHNSLYFFCGVS